MKRPGAWKRTDHLGLRKLKALTIGDFQMAIRAEAGAKVGRVPCIHDSDIIMVMSELGSAVCVTCGKILKWSGEFIKDEDGAHAGHFLPGKRNSVVFEETNCHCQCSRCNMSSPVGLSGNLAMYSIYIRHRYGVEEIDRLKLLDNTKSVSFERDQLNGMRDGYKDRWKRAVGAMK